jgi:hypothetical protein
MSSALPNYDAWKQDPDFGRSHRELEQAERRAELPISWQCEHGIHHKCRVGRHEGTATNCGCECHEKDYCHTCHSYSCHCDELYEAARDQEDARG